MLKVTSQSGFPNGLYFCFNWAIICQQVKPAKPEHFLQAEAVGGSRGVALGRGGAKPRGFPISRGARGSISSAGTQRCRGLSAPRRGSGAVVCPAEKDGPRGWPLVKRMAQHASLCRILVAQSLLTEAYLKVLCAAFWGWQASGL